MIGELFVPHNRRPLTNDRQLTWWPYPKGRFLQLIGRPRGHRRRPSPNRPNRQRGVCRGACSQSLAKHQRWPAGGWRLLLGDCDSAASLLDRRFRAGTITSCVGTDGTDGRRDLDHPAIAWPGGAVIASLPAHALPQLASAGEEIVGAMDAPAWPADASVSPTRTTALMRSFQSGALGRGVGGFCYVAIEQHAGEGQQSAGSAVHATALSLSI